MGFKDFGTFVVLIQAVSQVVSWKVVDLDVEKDFSEKMGLTCGS